MFKLSFRPSPDDPMVTIRQLTLQRQGSINGSQDETARL
jgi:hypothetical protein